MNSQKIIIIFKFYFLWYYSLYFGVSVSATEPAEGQTAKGQTAGGQAEEEGQTKRRRTTQTKKEDNQTGSTETHGTGEGDNQTGEGDNQTGSTESHLDLNKLLNEARAMVAGGNAPS